MSSRKGRHFSWFMDLSGATILLVQGLCFHQTHLTSAAPHDPIWAIVVYIETNDTICSPSRRKLLYMISTAGGNTIHHTWCWGIFQSSFIPVGKTHWPIWYNANQVSCCDMLNKPWNSSLFYPLFSVPPLPFTSRPLSPLPLNFPFLSSLFPYLRYIVKMANKVWHVDFVSNILNR